MVHRGSFDAASHQPFRWHSYPKGVGMTRLDGVDVVWWSDAGALSGIELPNLAAASSGHQGVTLGTPAFFAADSTGERCAIQLDGVNDSISIGASPYTEGYFDFRASEDHLINIPYHPSFNVADDITILIKITAGDWTPGGIQTLASRWLPGTNYCWLFRLNGAGHLMYNWSFDGTTTFQVQSSASVVPPPDGNVWVAVAHDVNNGTGGNVVRFFTTTNFSEPTAMPLLSAHTDPSTVTGIYPSTSAPIRLGSRDSNQERLYGRLRTLIVRGSVNGPNIGLTNEVVRIDADIVVNEADTTIPMPVPAGHVATVSGNILRRPIGGAACFGPGESGTIILCGQIEPTQPAGARLFDSQPASMMGGQAINITATSGTAITARTARAGLGTETTVAGTASTVMPEVICVRIDRAAGLLKLWTNSGGETTTPLDPAEGSSQRFTDIRIGSSNENSQYANFDFYSGAILRGAISNDDLMLIKDMFLNGTDTYDDSDTWTATTPGIFDGTFFNPSDQVLAINPNAETAAGYLSPAISGANSPDTPDLAITGNIRLTAKVRMNDLTTGTFQTFAAQIGGGPPEYSWRWSSFYNDNIVFGFSTDGTNFTDYEVLSAADFVAKFQAGVDFCIGLNLDFDNDTAQSFTSDDDGMTWYPINAPVSVPLALPANVTTPLEIGRQHVGSNHVLEGRTYWVQVESAGGASRYLIPTIGIASSPDPGRPPLQFHYIFEGTTDAMAVGVGSRQLASADDGDPRRSWVLDRNEGGAFGYYMWTSADVYRVTAFPAWTAIVPGQVETWAFGVDQLGVRSAAGNVYLHTYRPDGSGGWTEPAAANAIDLVNPIWNGQAAIRIGSHYGDATPQANRWAGQVRRFEMRSGLKPGDARHLIPTIGTVTTPDPGPLPGECTLIVDIEGPEYSTASQAIASQWVGPSNLGYLFFVFRDAAQNAMQFNFSPAGNNASSRFAAVTDLTSSRKRLAFVVNQATGLVRFLRSDNGGPWNLLGEQGGGAITIFDSTAVLRIGGSSATALPVNGRIYSVELRTGLDPAPTDPRYLTSTVSSAYTPDLDLPDECVFVFKTRTNPSDYQYIVGQWAGGQYSWGIFQHADGRFEIPFSANGQGNDQYVFGSPSYGVSPSDETFAVSMRPRAVDVRVHHLVGGVWQSEAWQHGDPRAPFPSTDQWRIGNESGPLRIYSVEMRTGVDPASGQVIWRFDASEAPTDVATTTWADPRGRSWSVSNPQAISGRTLWKFDANEAPTDPTTTTWADPRGRQWTVTNPAAISGRTLWKFDATEAPTDTTTTTWSDPRGRQWTTTPPQAVSGRTFWRFDASDYPGTGTSYVDPRGRTWSVNNASALTPLVLGLDESIPFDEVDWARVPAYTTFAAIAPPAVTHFGLVEMNGPPTPHEASFFEDSVIYPYRRLDIHNHDGSLWIENAPLISGSVNIDYSRDERRSGDCEIWLPEAAIGPGGLWYDKIFKFYRGLTLGAHHREPNYRGATLVWQIGSFIADRISEGSESANFRVTFRDQTKRMMLSKLIEATTFPEGTEIATVVRAVAANSGVLQMLVPATGKMIGKDFTFEAGTSRWEIAKKVANDFGYELFFDHRGWLVMRPFTDPLTSPIYLYLVARRAGLGANGQKSNVGSYDRSASDERIYNHVVVTAEGTDRTTVYRAEAENTLPNSPTSIARIGRRTMAYNSSFITSPQQCQETADALLAINALEQFTINVGTIVYPWIEVGTTIHFDEDKTVDNFPSRYLLLNATIPLGLEAMSLGASRVTIIGKAEL